MNQYMNKKKTAIYVILLAILTLFIYTALFKDQDIHKIFDVLISANPSIIIAASLLIILFILCEAFNINLLLKSMRYNTSLFHSIKYAITGFFYSSITPSSTGGQPMQLYKMKKDGINLSHGTLILLVELACFQTVTLIFSGIAIAWMSIPNSQITNVVKFLAYLGFAINTSILIGIWTSIFSKKFLEKIYIIAKFLINKSFFISEIKKKDLSDSVKKNLNKYNQCSEFLKKQPLLFLKCLSITFIQVIGLFSIPYLVYLALNQNSTSFVNMFMMQSIVYSASSFIPLPGASGVSESNYMKIFSKIYSLDVLNSAVLLTRFVNFYFPVILSLGVLLCIQIASKKSKLDKMNCLSTNKDRQ